MFITSPQDSGMNLWTLGQKAELGRKSYFSSCVTKHLTVGIQGKKDLLGLLVL